MTAAISAARLGKDVILLEAQQRVGRKLLSTGNGRCNISNARLSERNYRSDDIDKLSRLLEKTSPKEISAFLSSVGVECFEEREGRIYPRSEQASAVLDLLRAELERLRVRVECDSRASRISGQREGGFSILAGEREYRAKRVICACGSKAAPQLGGCQDGERLLARLGHSAPGQRPALVPVEVRSELVRFLKGIRVRCRLSLYRGGKMLVSESGELQINDNNLSGIVTMQLSSRIVREGAGCEIEADLFPELTRDRLISVLVQKRRELGYLPAELFMSGMLKKRLCTAMLRLAGVDDPTKPCAGLTDGQLERLADGMKRWRFPVAGTQGFKQAQVASGGIPLGEFDEKLESLVAPGVFACGEVLDCDGDCGGYNLHWAWCSGITAGKAAAAAL